MEFVQRPRRVEKVSLAPASYGAVRNRDARKPRHAGIFEAIHRLDGKLDESSRNELSDWIRAEYEREFSDFPLGLVAVCFLGPPYVDHRMDLLRSILDHFSAADRMPEPFEQARMLARVGAYEFIEVYATGRLVPVRPDGTAVTVEG
jgi:hypothetical protein